MAGHSSTRISDHNAAELWVPVFAVDEGMELGELQTGQLVRQLRQATAGLHALNPKP